MSIHPGRNDPCPCGSGNKYKKCCAGKATVAPPQVPQAEIGQLIDLFHAKRYAEVESRASLLLQRNPDFGKAWKMLGAALGVQGKDALSALQKAAQLLPNDADAHYNLGRAWQECGQLDGAVVCYRQALAIEPKYVVAHNNLGQVLRELGQQDAAAASFQRALKIKPDYAEAHYNLGNALQYLGQLPAALVSYRKALALKPYFPLAQNNMGNALKELGDFDAALACYRRALELDPGYFEAQGNILFALNFSACRTTSYLDEARQYGRMVAWKAGEHYASWRCETEPKRLRVGLVSGDLRNHPVGYFLESLLAQFDPSRIEIFAYPTNPRANPKTDELSTRIQPYFADWKPLHGKSDAEAAQLIHADGVHILLDLSGHTRHSRLPVFAWKPAPVQASWLGYFATTGVAEMDYLLADEVGVPEAQRENFTESLCYLPDTRLCFTPPKFDLPVAPLPALANRYLTFGCFQRVDKIGEPVLAVWGKIFAALPHARLRLASKLLGDPAATAQFTQRLQQHGIAPSRVALHGAISREAYLAAHAEVDVILDTFPYPGGTTTCEALWMGVPTLTLAGDTLLARQGASLLTAASLSDWVATSEAEYVEKTMQLTSDLPKLAALRASLREQMLASPLCNASRFAHNFEAALWEMWRQGHDQQLAHARRQAYEAHLTKLAPVIEIVSATRYTEQAFWDKSALGISLRRLALDTRLIAHIAFENRRGLPEVFNERIHAQDAQEILVFIHDDVWIDDYQFADRVIEGLEAFDVVGVAGNRRRVKNQSKWGFVGDKFTREEMKYLSGQIAHGDQPYGVMSYFGEIPAACEFLDGVFIAAKRSRLLDKAVQFDQRFNFHFYDLDFCRSARAQDLSIGTWSINLTHQSEGNFESASWRENCRVYLDKWKS